MSTTQINPGSLTPYKFRNTKGILFSFRNKIQRRQWKAAWRFLVTEISNQRRKDSILEGSKYHCPVCDNDLGGFVHLSNSLRYSWNSACPHCSSRSRHRGLYFLYKQDLKPGMQVMHFAPEPVFYDLFTSLNVDYKTTDYFLEDVDFPGEDIQNLSFDEDQYEVVLCNHVIEHVPDDEAAIMEMNRILKPGGKAIITIPGDFQRGNTLYFDHLDFNGHYRDYGMDFRQKLTKYFDNVEVIDLHKFDEGKHGIKQFEIAFIGIKKS